MKTFLITMIVLKALSMIGYAISLRGIHPRRISYSQAEDFFNLFAACLMLGWVISLLVNLP